MNTSLKLSSIVFAALSVAAMGAHADDADPSGQFAASAGAKTTQAQAYQRAAGVSPWSTAYNPLAGFRSNRSRAEVQAEYLASRNAVAAMTSEDSGSAFLAQRRPTDASTQLAGQPVNAQ